MARGVGLWTERLRPLQTVSLGRLCGARVAHRTSRTETSTRGHKVVDDVLILLRNQHYLGEERLRILSSGPRSPMSQCYAVSKELDLLNYRTRLVERQEVTSIFNGRGLCDW